jgi:hypothetical protein
MRRSAPRATRSLAVLLLVTATACTDRNPAAAPDPTAFTPPPARAVLACTVSVRAATLACAPRDAATPSSVSAAVVGGQGSAVRLTTEDARYDGTSVFRADVALENLTAQALGTVDGETPAAEGVRVFFGSGPVATAGTGAVEVANADGEGFFTGAAQKFFRYDGIVAPGGTSAAREWRFSVPGTVESFTFDVFVASPVRAEGGWLSMAPLAPGVKVGDTVRVTPLARDLAGGAADPQPVTWTTSNAAVATVDAQGLVTGVATGAATVTATGGGRSGSVRVAVYADGVATPLATVHRFEVLDAGAAADGADSVRFRVAHSSAPGVPQGMDVVLRHPGGAQHNCRASAPVQTPSGPEWRCAAAFVEGSPAGAWRVAQVSIANRALPHAALVAAGAPAFVYVTTPTPDVTPPVVAVVAVSPPTVTAGVNPVTIDVVATHGRAAATRMEAYVSSARNPRIRALTTPGRMEGGSTHFQFRFTVPAFFHGGTFVLDSLAVWDVNDNRGSIGTAAMAAAGFATSFNVISTSPDSIPPVITAFGFSPGTVAGNGVDSVTVTMTATEPAAQSGTQRVEMEFERVADTTQRRRCLLSGPPHAYTRTMTCRLAFAAADAGAWRVRHIRTADYMGNARQLDTEQLRAAGYATDLSVTAP